MFSIRLLPESQTGFDGQRLGQITVGDFTERFACHPISGVSVTQLEAHWRQELRGLVEGRPAVVLQHDPRFAWVVYRGERECWVQQRFSADGTFDDILPRGTQTDDGQRISEWRTTLRAIADFVSGDAH